MHGELSGRYDRAVSDRNQLPDLTYEEISNGRGGEREGEFVNGLRDRLPRIESIELEWNRTRKQLLSKSTPHPKTNLKSSSRFVEQHPTNNIPE